MHKHIYQQPDASTQGDAPHHSSLTINHPRAAIGLMNLLDLIEHRIEPQAEYTVHWLTFSSGKCLRVVADSCCVTVEGEQIAFHPSEIYPFNTLLSNPQ